MLLKAKKFIYNPNEHPFHIVNPSPWPLLTAFSSFSLTFGAVLYMHSFKHGGWFLFLGLLTLIICLVGWWRDVIREATFEGQHTLAVQRGIRMGMILFIVSEIMFFVAFFWGFFHSSLSPAVEIGGIWPPKGIEVFDPYEIPLVNTFILLLSGASVTWAHHAILAGNRKESILGLIITVSLGLFFSCLQLFEYIQAPFTISDSIYGSVFYMLTGFHGFHVLIGTIFLLVTLIRHINYHFTIQHHVGFECASWYWHFVDVVWIFLYLFLYIWGS